MFFNLEFSLITYKINFLAKYFVEYYFLFSCAKSTESIRKNGMVCLFLHYFAILLSLSKETRLNFPPESSMNLNNGIFSDRNWTFIALKYQYKMKIKEKQLFNFLFANKGNLPNIGEYPSQFRFKTADTFFLQLLCFYCNFIK